nr:hypothetical protein [Tanacetum cinerariifolium]
MNSNGDWQEMVILVVIVVAIVGVVIVVTIIGVIIGVVVVVTIIGVVVVIGVFAIIKLSFVIIGFEAVTFPSMLLGNLASSLENDERSDIGIQEKKAKLFNEWERFTSNERESIEPYYHRFLKLMNDLKKNKHFSEKIASNLKFLNNLQPEWSRHVTIVHQTKDLHTADYTKLYDFLKYNQKEVDELKAERFAKIQDPLALMANSNNLYASPAPHQDQSPFNQNFL